VVLIQDALPQLSEVLVVEEVVVQAVLHEVARQVEQQGPSAGEWREEVVLLQLLLLGLHVYLLVLRPGAAEELIEEAGPQGEDGGNQPIFAEGPHLVLGNGEVSRIDLVLGVDADEGDQACQLALVALQHVDGFPDLAGLELHVLA
jgi:hypothetical protein